jgi:hypothetical protein
VSLDQAATLQPMKSRVQRALLNPKYVTRHLLDTLGDGPPVLATEGKCPENKQIQSPLWKDNMLAGHYVPFHFYTKSYATSCRSARGTIDIVKLNSYARTSALSFEQGKATIHYRSGNEGQRAVPV